MRDELIVDLRAVPLASLDESGGISEVLDAHSALVVRVAAAGLFAPGAVEGDRPAAVFADAGRARPERVPPPG